MSDQDDMLLEFFMCLPQLKQVTSDKEELVNNIVEIASEFSADWASYLILDQFWTKVGSLEIFL